MVEATAPRASSAERLTNLESLRAEMEVNFHAYEEIRSLTAQDRDELFTMLIEAQAGNPDVLSAMQDIVYEELPVDMEEFILGKRYLGMAGLINTEKIELLIEFDRPRVRRAFCAAGSGSGKSFMVSAVQARMIYRLLCLRRPDLFYMLGPGSRLACINLSISKEQARDVVFTEFVARITHAPWFKNKMTALTSRAKFPKEIYAMSGGINATSYYGYHTIMGSLDEASFMFDSAERSIAADLVEALLKSLSTRFPRAYKLFIISTLRSTDDFLYTEIERVKESGVCVFQRDSGVRP